MITIGHRPVELIYELNWIELDWYINWIELIYELNWYKNWINIWIDHLGVIVYLMGIIPMLEAVVTLLWKQWAEHVT